MSNEREYLTTVPRRGHHHSGATDLPTVRDLMEKLEYYLYILNGMDDLDL